MKVVRLSGPVPALLLGGGGEAVGAGREVGELAGVAVLAAEDELRCAPRLTFLVRRVTTWKRRPCRASIASVTVAAEESESFTLVPDLPPAVTLPSGLAWKLFGFTASDPIFGAA